MFTNQVNPVVLLQFFRVLIRLATGPTK